MHSVRYQHVFASDLNNDALDASVNELTSSQVTIRVRGGARPLVDAAKRTGTSDEALASVSAPISLYARLSTKRTAHDEIAGRA